MIRSISGSLGFGLFLGFIVAACSSKVIRQVSQELQKSSDSRMQLVGNSIAGTQTLSAQDERELGAELAGALIKIHGLHPDKNLQKYVNTLGQYLGKQSTLPNLKWRFAVINTEDYNAFSTPGGYILISHGLMKTMQDEAELAGVLAHEIIHVTDKHHVNAIKKTSQAAGVANLGQMLGEKNKGKAGEAAGALLQVGSEVFARGLDKKDEFQADRKGVLLARSSGYDAYGLVRVLYGLAAQNPQDSKVALLFKTHPSPEERISQLDQSLGANLDSLSGGLSLDKPFIAMMSR